MEWLLWDAVKDDGIEEGESEMSEGERECINSLRGTCAERALP